MLKFYFVIFSTENQGLQSNHGTVVNVKYILSDIYTDDFVEPNALDTDYSIKYQAIADFLFKHDHLTRSIFIKHNSTKCPRCIQNINESNEQQVFIKKSCWFYCLKLFYLLNLTEPKLNYELAVKLIFGYDLNLIDQIRQLSGTFSVREIFIEPPKMSLNDPKVKTLEKPIKLTCISKRVNNKIYQTYLDIIKNPPKLGHNVSYNIPITGYIKLPDYRFKGQEKQQLDFLDYAEKIDIKMWLLKSSIEYLLKSSCQYIPGGLIASIFNSF